MEEKPHLGLSQGNLLDVTAGLITVGLLALSYAGKPGLPRLLLALAFTFFVPGRAVVTNWPRMAAWSEVTTSMVLSLALLTLLATCALWVHVWKPTQLFEIEALLSLAALCLGTVRRNWHQPRGPARQTEAWHGDIDNG